MTMSTNGGPGQAAPQETRRSSLWCLNTLKTFPSKIRTRRSRSLRVRSIRKSEFRSMSARTRLSDSDIEVSIKLEGKAEAAGALLFRFDLDFAGVFRIRNVPPESLNPVVLIECPRLLFPFAREIIATAVRNGGFPPLLLDPVDFVSLYRQKMAQAQPAASTVGS